MKELNSFKAVKISFYLLYFKPKLLNIERKANYMKNLIKKIKSKQINKNNKMKEKNKFRVKNKVIIINMVNMKHKLK